jgi:hypothetical protein
MSEKKEQKSETKSDKQDEYPKFKDDGIKTTKVSSLKEKVKLAMEQLHDMATMEVLLPVPVRMKKRLESIKKMSSAESFKIDGHWKTIAPQIHISNLQGRKLGQYECEIRFNVFDVDDDGNKKLYEHSAQVEMADGSKVKRTLSAEYKIAYEVIERISYRKPIEREIVRILENKK